jgi:hypothetical protein
VQLVVDAMRELDRADGANTPKGRTQATVQPSAVAG